MELRPRRGRSAQPPSTPTIGKPSPRPPPQSSSRKKPPPVPATPILIPSDGEDADLEEIHPDPVAAAPKDIHTDSVAAAPVENGDQSTLKQDNQDIILPDSSEFETPLSSIVNLHRAQKKLASSSVKSKTKVTSSVKKTKMVEELGSTPVADTRMEREGETCIANDIVTAALEEVGLDEATTKKVFGALNGEDALEETEKREVFTGSVPQNSNELAVEITVMDVCSKKTEVLSPSSKSKTLYSTKNKSAKKRDEDNEVVDAKLDHVDAQEHIVDVDAPIVGETQALSLVLSDDETAQVLNAAQVEGCAGTVLASEEAALEKRSSVAEASKTSSTGKKSQSNKKGIMKEDNLSRKLFEETSDITTPSTDTEATDQIRHDLGSTANPSKESASKIDNVEVEKCAERVSSSSKRHNFESPSRSLKEREVADLEMFDSDGDKLDASDIGVQGKDIVNDRVQDVSEESSDEAVSSSDERDVSEESSDEAVSSSDERDEDISNDHDKLNAATSGSQKNAVHVEECRSSNDDSGNSSSGSDDDDEDETASAFFSSMKAHLQRISEPSCSGLSTQKGMQEKQEALDSQFTKSTVKEPCANGGLTGHGLSWCPEVVLSTSKASKAQAGKPRSIVEASPHAIWGRDRCLQDGLCVPPVDPVKLNKLARKQKDNTAGAKWFNLSAPTITPELKKELQILKLRGALDPKRHYKAEDSKGLPKFFQVGTVVGGPADFYSGRLTKKEQKSSLASELLSDSSLTAYRKRKYTEIQDLKQAGGKGFWKKKKSKRTPAWAKI